MRRMSDIWIYFFFTEKISVLSRKKYHIRDVFRNTSSATPSPPYPPLPRPPQHYTTMSSNGTERQVQSVSTKFPHSYWFLDRRKYFLLHRSRIFQSHSLAHEFRINSKTKKKMPFSLSNQSGFWRAFSPTERIEGRIYHKGIARGSKRLGCKPWAWKPVVWRQKHVLECVKMTEVICKGRNSVYSHLILFHHSLRSPFVSDLPIILFLFLSYQSLLPSLLNSFSKSIPQAVKWLANKRKIVSLRKVP